MIGDGDVFGHTDETAEDDAPDDVGTGDVVLDMNAVNNQEEEQQDGTGEIENTDEPNLNVVTTPEDDDELDNSNNPEIEKENMEEDAAAIDDDME